MDSHRATKRRRLDNAERGSSSSAIGSKSKKCDSQISNGTTDHKVREAWQQAQAKANERRGRRLADLQQERKGVDVYDDIDGAHNGQPSPKSKVPNSAPVKKHFDPLRNRKNAAPTSSPSKGASTLGFFKQFHQPRADSSPTTPKPDSTVANPVNGLSGTPLRNRGKEDETSDTSGSSSSEEDDEQPAAVNQVPPSAKGSMKGWAYEVPKKTFEDEIKELAETARQDASKSESNGAATGSAQKLRDRMTVSKRMTTDAAASPKPSLTNVTRKKPKATTTPRTKQSSQLNSIEQQNHSAERASQTVGAGTPSKSRDEKIAVQALPIHTTTPTRRKVEPQVQSQIHLKELTFAKGNLACIQKILLEKLTGQRLNKSMNLDDEYAKISSLITQTITAGESNSMLVIGARGCGKTSLVNQILHEQSAEHSDDFHVVRLNGFIHTDDKIALREIWRQLGREMELDEEESMSKNLADTLTTLLALLSHPAEQGRDESGQVTKSVIFVLDEFELFANHPRQTLLYNLFDIAQSRKAPIAVLGLTTRVDVVESLEKRVKSRFSHRYVHLSSTKSFTAFRDACKASISIHQQDLSADEREQLGVSSELTAKLKSASGKQKMGVVEDWNAMIDALMSSEPFEDHLHRIHYTTKSVPDFQASMLMPISTISADSDAKNTDVIEHITTTLSATNLYPPDSKLTILPSLSTLQLALLICAARLTNIHNVDNVPFAQAYEEYKVLASKAKLQASASGALGQGASSRVWGKEVAKGAWEDLVEFGLVMEDGVRGCRVDVGLEEIGGSGVELGAWGRWCREI